MSASRRRADHSGATGAASAALNHALGGFARHTRHPPFLRIVLPRGLIEAAPSLGNQFTVMVKSSSLVSVISVACGGAIRWAGADRY
jgi:ABC-type arginine transport system permease subunit